MIAAIYGKIIAAVYIKQTVPHHKIETDVICTRKCVCVCGDVFV